MNPKRSVSNDVPFPAANIAIMVKHSPLKWGLAILVLLVAQLVQQTAASTVFFAFTVIGGAAAWDPPVPSPISIDNHAAMIFCGARMAAMGAGPRISVVGTLTDLFMVRAGRIVPRAPTERVSFSSIRCICTGNTSAVCYRIHHLWPPRNVQQLFFQNRILGCIFFVPSVLYTSAYSAVAFPSPTPVQCVGGDISWILCFFLCLCVPGACPTMKRLTALSLRYPHSTVQETQTRDVYLF